MVKSLHIRLVCVAFAAAAIVSPANAVETNNSIEAKPVLLADAGRAGKQPPKTKIDKELETAVCQMVEDHLPDLQSMLNHLRNKEPKQYELAIRNLSKYARRLESAKKRGEQIFEFEVESVKAQSAVDVLVAKLKVRDNKSDREALRKAVGRLHDATLSRAKFDVTQLELRLKRTQQQLDTAKKRVKTKQSDSESSIEKSYATYLRRAGRLNRTPKSKKRPNSESQSQ